MGALASAHINSQIGEGFQMGADTVQQVFKGVTSRLNQFRKDATTEWGQMMEDHLAENTGKKQMQDLIQAIEFRTGKTTGDFIAEFLIDGTVDLSKWSSDRVNDLMNEIIPDAPILTEEEKQNVKQANYKYEPTTKN